MIHIGLGILLIALSVLGEWLFATTRQSHNWRRAGLVTFPLGMLLGIVVLLGMHDA